jgi:hypothetical protein
MDKRKTHKQTLLSQYSFFVPLCTVNKIDPDAKMSSKWKPVTCKLCLKKRENRVEKYFDDKRKK